MTNETNEKKKSDYRLLLLIVSQKLGVKAQDILADKDVPTQYSIHAKGTASGEFAAVLGLGGIDKTVLLSLLPKKFSREILQKLQNQLYLGTPNSGVAFTVPLTGASASVIRLMQSVDTGDEERSEEHMENKYAMIMAFVDQGFSEDIMAAAKPAGARGGTVFHSRRVLSEEAQHFFGITVQEEREIVMILAEKENKVAIMKAIGEKFGASSDAHGIVVSLPVDAVAGLNKDIAE